MPKVKMNREHILKYFAINLIDIFRKMTSKYDPESYRVKNHFYGVGLPPPPAIFFLADISIQMTLVDGYGSSISIIIYHYAFLSQFNRKY